MKLTLIEATGMVDAALAEAGRKAAKPLAVIVLDAGGHPIIFKRQDGASLFRLDIARAKATGALGMGADSRAIAERAAHNPMFFTTVAIATGGNLALSPGGVLIMKSSELVGAIGISGDAPEVDETCAKFGIAQVLPQEEQK